MVNTANTAWKLTDLWNTSLFTFDLTNGWHPTNENQSAMLAGEIKQLWGYNLSMKIDYGLGARNITLQGVDIADRDMWVLSSVICKRQLMKLWVGEDAFYYVLGVEPRQIRDETLPLQKSYTVGFIAPDPHYYYANTQTEKTVKELVGPTTIVGAAWSGGSSLSSSLTANLSASDRIGTTNVEPVFWIIGSTNTNITVMNFTDQLGRSLTYTPTSAITTGKIHVIMPWRNTAFEGFIPNDSTGFYVVGDVSGPPCTIPAGTMGGSVTEIGAWAADIFNHGAGTDVNATAGSNVFYGYYSNELPCALTLSGNFIPKNRLYPQFLDGVSSVINVTATGTTTNAKVFAQFCQRMV